jgi:exodeoxyribonuclease V alpha subunit
MDEIDYRFAKALLKERADPELTTFLATLCYEARRGAPMTIYPGIHEKAAFLLKEDGPLVRYGDAYYLERNWRSETRLLSALEKFLQESVEPLDFPYSESLYPAQREALSLIAKEKLVVITGGPGSGKSRVARELFSSFLALKPEAEIIAAAPTGKALSRLQYPKVTTKTLHALLGLTEKRRTSKKRIEADLLLIDECSMIDLSLFEELFLSLTDGMRLVLVGDPEQLPPVGTRGIFPELASIETIPHVHLDQVKRTDKEGLIQLAKLVLEGKGEEALTKLEEGVFPEISLSPLPKTPPLVSQEGEVILTPFSVGLHGTQSSNAFNKAAWQGERLPILITKNDYTTGLMNGDVGWIEKDKAYFPDNKVLQVALLPPYEYAFALTIHKSQGSEFRHVKLLLPEGSHEEGCEILYTAITRAQETLQIFCNKETFLQIIAKKTKKESLFKERFLAARIYNN